MRAHAPLLSRCVLSITATVFVFAAGCEGDQPDKVGVSGTVTLDGDPLPDAYVTFMPQFGGRPSAARTDSQGRYELIYGRRSDGAQPGDYSVSIRTYVAPVTGAEDFEQRRGISERVPAQYNAHTTLTATVTPGGATIDFDLDSAGEIILPPGAEGYYGSDPVIEAGSPPSAEEADREVEADPAAE